MPIKIVICLTIGILIGIFIEPQYLGLFNNSFSFIGLKLGILEVILTVMMFLVGIDIALQHQFIQKLKSLGKEFFIFPLLNVMFSLIGGAVGALIIQYDVVKGVGVASAMGWYTFSTVEFAKVSIELSAIAFLTNSLRELFSMILMPIIGRKFDKMAVIAMSGATCMDTNLPVAMKSIKDEKIAVIAIISGTILSLLGAVMVVIIASIIK